jgi:hypothetical protein
MVSASFATALTLVTPTGAMAVVRRGARRGELSMPIALEARGDSILVLDLYRSTVLLLERSGRFIGERSLPYPMIGAAALGENGNVLRLVSKQRTAEFRWWNSSDSVHYVSTGLVWRTTQAPRQLVQLGGTVAFAYRDIDGCLIRIDLTRGVAALLACLPNPVRTRIAAAASPFYARIKRNQPKLDFPIVPFEILGTFDSTLILLRSAFPIGVGTVVSVDPTTNSEHPVRFVVDGKRVADLDPDVMGQGSGVTMIATRRGLYLATLRH